jgi:hypothetical protein
VTNATPGMSATTVTYAAPRVPAIAGTNARQCEYIRSPLNIKNIEKRGAKSSEKIEPNGRINREGNQKRQQEQGHHLQHRHFPTIGRPAALGKLQEYECKQQKVQQQ